MAMQINLKKIAGAVVEFISKYYLWFVALEAVLILVVGWFVLLDKELTKIEEAGLIGYEDTSARLQERENYLLQLQTMETEYSKLSEERLQQMDHLLPVGLEPASVINRMSALAEQAGLAILSIDVVKPEPVAEATITDAGTIAGEASKFTSKDVRTATITLNIESGEGTYEELKLFLDTLESFVPILDLQNLTFSPGSASYALQLQTYFLHPGTTVEQTGVQ
ncbi:MAG: hypothetical protein ABIG66_02275 [Candidatus Kerfeldbacteria bacterium]